MRESVLLNRKRERRRTAVAFVASLAIHLLILLIALVVFALSPEIFKRPVENLEPAEFTLIPPPEPTPEERRFIDSSQGEVTEEKPENAAFESDQNTRAASENPPEGSAPLPTTQSETEEGMDLRDQMLTMGPAPMPAPATQPEQRSLDTPEVLPPEPAPTPQPTPEPTPEPTPLPTPEVTELPEQSDMNLLEPVVPEPTPTPQTTPPPEVRRAETATPERPAVAPGFQQQTRTTRITGGVTSRGRASVAAEATPLGRYKKMLSDAIGSRWYYYVNDMMDLVSIGTVEIRFIVRANGTVEGVRVLRNTANESLASCSVRSVIEAEIPPIPPEVVKELEGGSLEVDYSFTIVGR